MATAVNAAKSFAAADAAAVGEDATYIGIWTASSGGTFLWGRPITTNRAALVLGQQYQLAAGAVVITQNIGTGETEAMAVRALNGKLAGTLYFAVHDGNTGSNGANEITDIDRISITLNEWTIAES